MNQAALYSAGLLVRFDDAEEQDLLRQAHLAAQQESEPCPRSGRLLSSQPFGTEREQKTMEEGAQDSDALVRVKTEAGPSNAGAHLRHSSHSPIQRSPPLFPASSLNAPGEDASRQIATLQAKLQQRLGPEYISSRQGPSGGKQREGNREGVMHRHPLRFLLQVANCRT